jgi:RES domain-containing protein
VLHLTDAGVRGEVGLGLEVLTGPDWAACQDLGATAHALGVQAILSPLRLGSTMFSLCSSSTSVSAVEPTLVEQWQSIDQIRG